MIVNPIKSTLPAKTIKAKFACDLSQLQDVRHFVQEICQSALGNSDRFSFELQLVINEIFCNIVKHGYCAQSTGEILIEGQLEEEGAYFTILDKGISFNSAEAKSSCPAIDKEHGFGLFIIQQLVDQMSYAPKTHSEEWNRLRIFKRFLSKEEPMEFSSYIQEGVLVVIPMEENLDAKNVSSFKEGVFHLIQTTGKTRLIFDLTYIQFIDSSGLGTFLSIQRQLSAQEGSIRLACLNKPVRAMFEIVSMDRMFGVYETVEEALQSF